MFQEMPGISATMVNQLTAAQLMNPKAMRENDALVLYDLPGLDFSGTDSPLVMFEPDPARKSGFLTLLDQRKGVVALHHALAGWPTWDEYGGWLGGRFLHQPRPVRGVSCLNSGYRNDVEYQVEIAVDHPVKANLPPCFAMTDELYLAEIFEADVTPLLRSSDTFNRDHF